MHWLAKANARVHGTTKKIPQEEFELKEKALLLKLPLQEFNLTKVGVRKVYHDCHIYIHHNYYSVPYQYVGKEVEIEIGRDVLKIYFNQQLIATHTVVAGKGEFSTCQSHYPAYKCMSNTEYQEKYQVKMAEIGEFAQQFFFAVLHAKKSFWIRPIQGVLSLKKKYSMNVINLSCQRALAYGAIEYPIIKNICQNGSYHLPLEY
ncbi:hypothetical protein BH10PSE19_BH10PSE19_16870 [soil metagenome]